MSRKKIAKKPKGIRIRCIRCNTFFSGIQALKIHNKSHLQSMKEMQLLEEGNVPSESKIGSNFKGKNRIIIS